MRFCVVCLAGGLALAVTPSVDAQSPETSRPVLERLNAEVQALYAQVQQGVVKVQLPPQKWLIEAADRENPLNDPKFKAKANKEVADALNRQRNAKPSEYAPLAITVTAATEPAKGRAKPSASGPAKVTLSTSWVMVRAPDGSMVMESRGGSELVRIQTGGQRTAEGEIIPAGKPQMAFAQGADFAPNNLGLLIDEEGHFLVPTYIEKDSIPAAGVKVAISDQACTARFVGSDRHSQLTVLKLDKPVGRPMVLARTRPAQGALVLLVSPNTGAGKLIVWTQNLQDFGVIANVDGSIAGFVRYGQFFTARAARPVIEQLIKTGVVRRAPLGVRVSEVRPEDPARQLNALLANRPALRVDEVTPGSVADKKLLPGDLIFAIGDEPVGDPPTFAAFLSACSGDTTLQIIRGGQTQVVTVDLKPPATKAVP